MLPNNDKEQCSFVSFPHVVSTIISEVTVGISVDLKVILMHICTIRCMIILYSFFLGWGGNPPYGPENMVITFPKIFDYAVLSDV
jgi:hypothetical protein